MPKLFQLRLCLLAAFLVLAAACKPAPTTYEPGEEPPPDHAEGEHEGFQGVLRLSPWPTLLVLEPDEETGEMIEVPRALVSPDWRGLELTTELRLLNGKLVELRGTPVVSGPARIIRLAPSAIEELEGSLGTPGRAAETAPRVLGEFTLTGRVFSLPFLARNGPKLPALDDQGAIEAQARELHENLPMVLLAEKDGRPDGLKSPLVLLTDHRGSPLVPAMLDALVNREATVTGTLEVQGAWQILRVAEGSRPKPAHLQSSGNNPQPAPGAPAP